MFPDDGQFGDDKSGLFVVYRCGSLPLVTSAHKLAALKGCHHGFMDLEWACGKLRRQATRDWATPHASRDVDALTSRVQHIHVLATPSLTPSTRSGLCLCIYVMLRSTDCLYACKQALSAVPLQGVGAVPAWTSHGIRSSWQNAQSSGPCNSDTMPAIDRQVLNILEPSVLHGCLQVQREVLV